jgi:hydroxymethylglutaryl-CoA synthase
MGTKNVIAEIEHTYSYTSDTGDFWRREGRMYPMHGGRFTGEPAYFRHVLNAGKTILEKSGLTAKDFSYAVFHMPNGKFPQKAGKILGFSKEQMQPGK